jgi:hypothetical protein
LDTREVEHGQKKTHVVERERTRVQRERKTSTERGQESFSMMLILAFYVTVMQGKNWKGK